MKKINNKGFVLAETLVVTVFLMVIFGMLYTEFYPLIGEYEKREVYDEVDGKYALYWIKKMIEDSSYNIKPRTDEEVNYLSGTEAKANKEKFFEDYGYVRFECEDIVGDDSKKRTCINLVKSLEIDNCDKLGNGCDIFITKYQLKGADGSVWFKDTVKQRNIKRKEENCFLDNASEISACQSEYLNKCISGASGSDADKTTHCNSLSNSKVFKTGFKDYIATLPDYKTHSINEANYRVTASFHHRKDNNNYYSYATIEVIK